MLASFSYSSALIIRLLGGLVSAFLLSLFFCAYFVKYLAQKQWTASRREHTPSRHLKKEGTPTSGGLAILIAYAVATLLWNALNQLTVWITLLTLTGFGSIGLLDDFYKIKTTHHSGLSMGRKYGLQSILGLGVAAFLYQCYPGRIDHVISSFSLHTQWFFLPWAYCVIVGSSNAINLTDGLDGLAISQVIIITLGLCGLALFVNLPEVAVLCSLLVGSSLGFLWYNRQPAKLFMGDVGALALGAFLGIVAILLRQELAFALMAFVPVVETVSVILQVLVFKTTKKRLLLMAPFHHHLELSGYSESLIVISASVVTNVTVFVSLFIVMR